MVGGHKMSRYVRQVQLPEVGSIGQAAIGAARILVVGVGGLAAPALQYLVGAGVGHLTLVDHDLVARTNLHRQTLFREADVGAFKAHAAASALRALNAGCKVVPVNTQLDPANARGLVNGKTLVLDCADSFAVSYTLSDVCVELGVPLFSASALGFTGYAGGFCGSSPSLRAVFPDLPDRTATCAQVGVMGPVVGMIGTVQAQMALAYLIGQSPSPLGQMMSFDMRNFRASGFRFDDAPEPSGAFTFIAPAEITASDVVIELRDTAEAADPVTPDAHRMTVSEFQQHRIPVATGKRAVFVCRSGLRAWQAATHLRSYWAGDISLISMGDMLSHQRQHE
mgnify:FL=1|tara:strand:- start:12028 stop:13041 length:1014 start_codon:yes stop_codon:yes gene_type:complete